MKKNESCCQVSTYSTPLHNTMLLCYYRLQTNVKVTLGSQVLYHCRQSISLPHFESESDWLSVSESVDHDHGMCVLGMTLSCIHVSSYTVVFIYES